MLSLVLHGCETWAFTLMEEHRLRQFAYEYIGKYLDTRGMEYWEAGECSKTKSSINLTLHQNIVRDTIKDDEAASHEARMGKITNTYRILV